MRHNVRLYLKYVFFSKINDGVYEISERFISNFEGIISVIFSNEVEDRRRE
jgi:hypothetical protein